MYDAFAMDCLSKIWVQTSSKLLLFTWARKLIFIAQYRLVLDTEWSTSCVELLPLDKIYNNKQVRSSYGFIFIWNTSCHVSTAVMCFNPFSLCLFEGRLPGHWFLPYEQHTHTSTWS